jgi:hypothetical protein
MDGRKDHFAQSKEEIQCEDTGSATKKTIKN